MVLASTNDNIYQFKIYLNIYSLRLIQILYSVGKLFSRGKYKNILKWKAKTDDSLLKNINVSDVKYNLSILLLQLFEVNAYIT